MPESVTDRPTKAHEYLFLLTKSARYFYDADAIKEPILDSSRNRYNYTFRGKKNEQLKAPDNPRAIVGVREVTAGGRNKRSVWTITTKPTPYAHFATFPRKLVEPCILAGSREGDVVLDTFCGSGTTVRVAEQFNHQGIGCDLAYHDIAKNRTKDIQRELVGL